MRLATQFQKKRKTSLSILLFGINQIDERQLHHSKADLSPLAPSIKTKVLVLNTSLVPI
jgi:hypothetical protein